MDVLILTDIEGISGVDSIVQITSANDADKSPYFYACERLMADTNAAVEGAVLAGAKNIYVVDGHGAGINFIDKKLDKRAIKVSVPEFVDIICQKKIDAYLQVGAHAKPGTINGFLDHVQNSQKWFSYKINGTLYGEIVQGSLFAGLNDIPCVMVSGDEAACIEAKECLGDNIATAVVKWGVGRNAAECLDLAQAEALIRDAAKEGILNAGNIKPFKIAGPYTIEVTHTRCDYCEECLRRCPDVERVDGRTVVRRLDEIKTYKDIVLG